MRMFRGFRVGFAQEDEADHAAAVEAGRQRGDREEREDGVMVAVPGGFDDGVLGVPTREEGDGAVRERGRDEGRRREGHLLQEAAHLEHVLFVVAAMDDRAGTEEEGGLEERVHGHVQHRELGVAEAEGAAHDAEVGERRVSQ